MTWEEIVILIIMIALSALITVVFKLVSKKWPTGIRIVFPLSPIVGYGLMYLSSETDTFLTNLWHAVLWGFIFAMIFLNVKYMFIGSKRTVESGKTLYSNIKNSVDNVKTTFKSQKDTDKKESEDSQSDSDKSED